MRIPLFRIWYSTTFTVLFIVFIVLAAISPADLASQSFQTKERDKVAVVCGCIVLTVIVSIFIFASRIYTNRMILAGIPKSHIPVEPGEVGKSVRRMVLRQLERSAIIAWESKPRDLTDEMQPVAPVDSRLSTSQRSHISFRPRGRRQDDAEILVSPENPPWGHIAHPGWSSPATQDTPSLQFSTVIVEMPNLIEARAISLAPPDPILNLSPTVAEAAPIPNAQVVALLQRPPIMGLRDYLAHLSAFGLIQPPTLGAQFVALYEHARFSMEALTEQEFRSLMAVFAEILEGMTALAPELLAQLEMPLGTDDDEQATPADSASLDPSGVVASISSGGSAVHYRTPLPDRDFDFSTSGARPAAADYGGEAYSSSEGSVLTAHSRARGQDAPVSSSSTHPYFSPEAGHPEPGRFQGTHHGDPASSEASSLASMSSVVRHHVPEIEDAAEVQWG